MAPSGGLIIFDPDGLLAERGGELAELGAGELDEFRWRTRAAPALEQRERRKERGIGRGREIEVDAHRHGIAQDGGGKIGRQMQAKHANL